MAITKINNSQKKNGRKKRRICFSFFPEQTDRHLCDLSAISFLTLGTVNFPSGKRFNLTHLISPGRKLKKREMASTQSISISLFVSQDQ